MGVLDAPAGGLTASQAAVLTSRLANAVDDAVLLVLGDSTGIGQTRWVYLLSAWLGQQFPACTVNYWQWNDTNQNYDPLGTAGSSKVVQTGTASRTDTSCATTSGSPTVTDAAIKLADAGRPVSGPGIPAATYVANVTDGASFTLSSSSTVGIGVNATATGTGVSLTFGPRKLDVYNASVSGQIAPYPIATTTRWTATVPVAPHCVIYSYGHNNGNMIGSMTYRLQAYPLARKIQEAFPQAGLIVTLQNPRAATDVEKANDLSRQRANAEMAAAEGYGVVDVTRRFLQDPNYAANLLNPDGLHPNDTAGSPAWAAEVQKHFKASLTARPAGPIIRDTWKFIPAGQFSVSEGTPTLGVVNASAPGWAFANAAQSGIVTAIDFPAHWAAYDVYAVWTVATGSGYTSANNQILWELGYYGLGSVGFSAPIDAVAGFSQTSFVVGGTTVGGASNVGTAYQIKSNKLASYSGSVPLTNRPVGFRLRRMGLNATDNLAANVYVYGLLLVRAA